MTIFQFTLKRCFRNKTNVIFLTLFPITFIFFPKGESWPHLPYGFQYFGILMLFVGIRLASLMLEDRAKGVVKRLAVAPIRHDQYLSQHLLAYSAIMIVQCVIVIAGGVWAGHDLYRPAWLLCLYISFSFTCIAIALAWITIYRNKDSTFMVYMSLITILVILGGLLMPIEMFPDMLKQIAVLFPTFWLAEGMKWIVFGENVLDFLLINGVLWLYTTAFMIIGSTRKIH